MWEYFDEVTHNNNNKIHFYVLMFYIIDDKVIKIEVKRNVLLIYPSGAIKRQY